MVEFCEQGSDHFFDEASAASLTLAMSKKQSSSLLYCSYLCRRGHIALEEDIAQIAAVITRFILVSVTQK